MRCLFAPHCPVACLLLALSGCVAGTAWQPAGSTPAPIATDPTTPSSPVAAPVATGAGPTHRLTFQNNCAQTIWVGALTNGAAFALPEGGGWEIAAGANHSIDLAGRWEGRFWGRTDCTTTGGTFKCATGDCGGLQCAGRGGQPASLAEFTLYDGTGTDFYDLSLVDGYNLTLAIAPTPDTYPAGTASGLTCGAPTCSADINALCPAELQQKEATGTVVACLSACSAHDTDATCCRNAYDTAAACPATPLSEVFKTACHDAYSYAYDDRTSTYTCVATGYTVTFCPAAAAATGP